MMIYKYFIVGGLAAVIDISLFTFFAGYLGLPWLPISTLSFCIATYTNYVLSIKYIFESGARYTKSKEIFSQKVRILE